MFIPIPKASVAIITLSVELYLTKLDSINNLLHLAVEWWNIPINILLKVTESFTKASQPNVSTNNLYNFEQELMVLQ